MNGIFRSGAVAALLIGACTTLITRWSSIVSNTALLWASIAIGATLASLVFSWGVTQTYKVVLIPQEQWTDPTNKRRIRLCAVLTCLFAALVFGVVLLLVKVDHDTLLIYATLWVMGSLTLCVASPFLWDVVFGALVPWMLAKEKQP